MILDYSIRPEAPGDERPIHDLVERAFAPMPFADGDEQDLVDALRERGELALSLVAVDPGSVIVGQVAFSPATIDHGDCGWFQMAPVAVCPTLQHRGIGSALIREGIERLRRSGANGVAVVGNPAYYERFGFRAVERLAPLSAHDAPFFRAMPLAGPVPAGLLRYSSAFG
ncbi:MAG: N-acetyltransferase [Novosphingobium sp.]|nr:N-acetyltransferase [Novosphingobium sp.]